MLKDYTDQTTIFDPKTWGYPVHLIGAGGINNCVGPALAKLGITEIHVWDDDILETRNCPAEAAYSYEMVGEPKVTAMSDAICYLDPRAEVHTHFERVAADTQLEGIVIAGVDSMRSRQIIWQCVQANYLQIPFFIDARSAGEYTSIFAFPPCDFALRSDYETWLFDDSEALDLPCGARNIAYIAYYMAYEITRLLVRFHHGDKIDFQRNLDHKNLF